MQLTEIRPSKLDPEKLIYVSFKDPDVSGEMPYLYLRYHCPCAICVDEHTGIRKLKLESLSHRVKPTRVEPIGLYALKIEWSDHHQTGIYPYTLIFEVFRSAQPNPSKEGL